MVPEACKRKCAVSGKTVYAWKLTDEGISIAKELEPK